MAVFAEATGNECINDRQLRDNEYIHFGAQQRPKWDCHLYFGQNWHILSAARLSATAELLNCSCYYYYRTFYLAQLVLLFSASVRRQALCAAQSCLLA